MFQHCILTVQEVIPRLTNEFVRGITYALHSVSARRQEILFSRWYDKQDIPIRLEGLWTASCIASGVGPDGFDAAGALYGCLTLCDFIEEHKSIPETYVFSDKPDLELRGTCILLMKLGTYNYPVTPEEFP